MIKATSPIVSVSARPKTGDIIDGSDTIDGGDYI